MAILAKVRRPGHPSKGSLGSMIQGMIGTEAEGVVPA